MYGFVLLFKTVAVAVQEFFFFFFRDLVCVKNLSSINLTQDNQPLS